MSRVSCAIQQVLISYLFLYVVRVKSLSHVRLFTTLWTVAHQAPLSKGFSRQEYWSGLQYSSPGDLPDPGIELRSPTLQADPLPSEPHGIPFICSSHTVFTKTIFLVIYGHWSVLSINYLSSDTTDFFKCLLSWACMWLLNSIVSRGTFQSLYSYEISLPSFSIQAFGMSVVCFRWFFCLFVLFFALGGISLFFSLAMFWEVLLHQNTCADRTLR